MYIKNICLEQCHPQEWTIPAPCTAKKISLMSERKRSGNTKMLTATTQCKFSMGTV